MSYLEDTGLSVLPRPAFRRRRLLCRVDVSATNERHGAVLERNTRVQADRRSHFHRWAQASRSL